MSGSWGYRKCAQILRTQHGWENLNDKRVERIWREHGLQRRRPPSRKKKVTGSSQNACHVRQAECANQVWAIDFVEDRTMDKRKLKILTVIDEYTREALRIEVQRRMGARQVVRVLHELSMERGPPAFIRSDNGGEFANRLLEQAMSRLDVDVALIAPGSPWQNGKNERFNGILSQEHLSREEFGNLKEAQVLTASYQRLYNEVRPHGSLQMQTPAAFAKEAKSQGRWFDPSTQND